MSGFRFLRLLSLASLIASCSCLMAQTVSECTIVGEVRVSRKGAPDRRIEVTLETRGAKMATTFTDDRGSFQFDHLEGNLYHVEINDDDYKPVSIAVSAMPFTNRMTIVHVDLVPKKEGASAPTPLGANAHMNDTSKSTAAKDQVSGGNPFIIDQAEYNKQFPPKALKEFQAGVKADGKGHSDDAIGHYKKALKMAPAFYPAQNNLGSDYLNKGDFNAAEAEFEQVTRGNPEDANAYFNLGNIALLTNRYDLAAQRIQEGLQKQPNSALGTFLMGSVLQRTRHPQAAEKALRQALEFDPKMTKAHLALVNLYLQERRTPDAVRELRAFLQQAPKDPMAPHAREVLQRLESQSARGPN